MTENSQKLDEMVNQKPQNIAEMRDGAGDLTAKLPRYELADVLADLLRAKVAFQLRTIEMVLKGQQS